MLRTRVLGIVVLLLIVSGSTSGLDSTITEIIFGDTLVGPGSIAVDNLGNVYVTGLSSDNAFKVTPDGVITEIINSNGDGMGNTLDYPFDIAVDDLGNAYVTGLFSANAFKITPDGVITEIINSNGDGMGNTLAYPFDIAVDDLGNTYVVGASTHNAFRICSDGFITKIIDSTGDHLGNALNGPSNVAVDGFGNAFVVGNSSHNVFKITPNAAIIEIIDSSGDRQGNALQDPRGIAVDDLGNVFVTGQGSDNAFKITPGGAIAEIINSNGDGLGHPLNVPSRIAVDDLGSAYVTGLYSDNAFKVTPSGRIIEIIDSTGDGMGNALRGPTEIAVDVSGNVYVLGSESANAFKIELCTTPTHYLEFGGCFAGPGFTATPCCDCSDFDADGDVDLLDFAQFQRMFVGPSAQEQIVIETVPVGNPGNTGELSGQGAGGSGPNRSCGAVDYVYSIGKYEVTAGQYTSFLNAVAATDTYGLYNPLMSSRIHGCKIRQIGSPGFFTYVVENNGDCAEDPDWVDRPVNFVSWGDAARFANWMHNAQPTGAQDTTSTEDGAYDLSATQEYYGSDGQIIDFEGLRTALLAVVREPDATWVIPSEDEWYKAAYHYNDGVQGSYWDYPTSSDATPSRNLVDPDPGNNATFYQFRTFGDEYTIGRPYYRTEIGAHENSDSPYGTFDQGGNVWEWNEGILYGVSRGLRGGSWGYRAGFMHAASRDIQQLPDLSQELDIMGFRIANTASGETTPADLRHPSRR